MIQFTTPTATFIVEKVLPLSDIYITFKQTKYEITKTNPIVTYGDTTTTLRVSFTQEETGRFASKEEVQVQVNWITPSGERGATVKTTIPVFENLLDEVIEYGN